jgi:enamine deaminase RidA (YjgF/YER057c/UK114 family)
MTSRQRVYSGGPWEAIVGYCRATRVGDKIVVAGTTAMKDGELVGRGDPAAQARQALETISQALLQLNSSLDDIVRYRIYLTNIEHWAAIAPVMSETFGRIHPVNTLVAVAALIDPDMLVEIEADAIAGSAAPVSDSTS